MKLISLLPLVLLSGVQAAPAPLPQSNESRICEFKRSNILAEPVSEVHTSTLEQRQSGWTPPSSMSKALDDVWAHQIATYSNALGFKNYGYDQIIAGKGNINFCVRWESSRTVTQAQRTQIETAAKRSFAKWVSALAGFDGFPYSSVNVKVVGWAVSDKNKLQGSTSGLDVYTTKDSGGIPECDPRCGRFFHQDGNYNQCPGGAARHYDLSLWLTDGFQGGAGGDWGARMGTDYFMNNVNADNIHIFLHELGHYLALDDFYDWLPSGQTNFLMNAGSASAITDFDKWMARDWWRHLKSRYNL